MAEQSPAGGVSLPETSGSALARAATAVTTPTVSNKTTSSRVVISVGCQLHGFLSMRIYRILPSVLSKNPIQLKRKKCQESGSEGATCARMEGRIFSLRFENPRERDRCTV
jgi:hypothetical protein